MKLKAPATRQPPITSNYADENLHSLQVVLAVLVELGRSNVEGDRDLALVTGRLDGLHQELEGLLGTRDVGGETTLVTDVGG